MKNPKIGIIGAGPAGLAAAYSLAKSGYQVHVFEAGAQVGGMCRTLDLWNQKVDLGPHRFFSQSEKVNKLWMEAAGDDHTIVNRQTRIYYDNKFLEYPLKAEEVITKLGLWDSTLCVLSYLKQKLFPVKNNNSFESWVTAKFGARLFEKFFKTYSEKLWGVKCDELDADFASQRIKGFSLYEAIANAVLKKKNKPKTLIDRFYYPKFGTGMIYENMAEKIKEWGGKLYLNSPVTDLNFENGKVYGLNTQDGQNSIFDHVISTMPLTILIQLIPETPDSIIEYAKQLRFRNTILVYLKIDGVDLFNDNWLYIHSPELKMGRITNFRNWSVELYGKENSTILALEFWCDPEEEFWQLADKELIQIAEKELKITGINSGYEISEGHVERIPKCYPVYFKGYKHILKPVIEYLKGVKGLQVIGRYGSYKYNNQDHSMLMGILASENIITPRKFDLWNINTDYETYQEV